MRITFVYLDLATDDPTYSGYFYHGIAYLSAVLKKDGHQTNLIQLTKQISFAEFQKRIKVLKPDLISFSSTSHMFHLVRQYAAVAKEITKVPIICGGVHPTICPEEVLSDENIDMICRGEGEMAFSELCQKIEKKEPTENIESIWIKKDGKVFKNKIRPCIPDLNQLPFPDREIFDYPHLNLEKKGVGTFMFSRGCPYQCAFCCEFALRKLYPNPQNYIRFRSPQLAIAEIKETIKKYPFIKFVRFDDDLLFVDRGWVKEFTKFYQKEVGLPFSADMRADLADEELFNTLKEAGAHLFRFGVESGNDYILKEVLNKGITTAQIKKAFKLSRKKGIKAQAYNMIGVPCEGVKEILDTIKLNAQIKPDISVVSIFYPYKGTHLYDFCLQKGFLKEEKEKIPQNYYSYSILSLPTIKKEQIDFLFHYFYFLKRIYSFLFKLPFSHPLVFLVDKIFSFRYAPKLINAIFNPLRTTKRKILKIFSQEIKQDTEAISN
ncbi:MAG: cobalamin-dependent protein [Candidatus Pacebacteria bacterium]|nr:cobalamin-dependent protein [Candidatus Paceibacterota bacterium]